MWSDNDTAVDLLGFQHLARAVTGIVRRPHLLPATVGVFGDWGSGKSSLLRIVEEDLKKDKGTLVLWFNGWTFEGYEDAKTALMGTILDELGARRTLTEKGKSLLKKLAKRVNWFRVVGTGLKYTAAFALAGPVGLGFAAAADAPALAEQVAEKVRDIDPKEAKEYLSEEAGKETRKAVREFRCDFEEMLAESDVKTLVVIIDDLDRCLPSTIIETLEAIKLFLFVKQSAFIIGADERLVRYAVRQRFPELPGENVEVGRDYLEKLVQFPVRLPALDGGEIETFINLLFTSIAGLSPELYGKARERALGDGGPTFGGARFNFGIAAEVLGTVPAALADRLSLSERIAPVLAAGLSGQPRQCKRFLNTLVMRLEMAESRKVRLEEGALAKLMLLEHFRPAWFRRLAEIQSAQDGKPLELAAMERVLMKPLGSHAGTGRKAGTARSGKEHEEESEPPLDGEFLTWLNDGWMKDWTSSLPFLGSLDLRPYFFFSRDKLGAMGSPARRLSSRAQQSLQDLLQDSEAKRGVALKEASTLSAGDAAGVYESLAARLLQEADLGAADSTLGRFLSWVEVRQELQGQALTTLSRIPDPRIPLSLPPKLVGLFKDASVRPSLRLLLERWKGTKSQPNLAKAAGNALERV